MQIDSPLTLDTIQPNARVNDPRRAPSRDELKGARLEWLRRGRYYKADVVKVDLGQGPIVIKDFSRKPWLWRRFGRFQIRREISAYRRLGRMEGLPRFLGAVDGEALALEWIDGGLLKTLPDRVERGARYVAELTRIVDRIHAMGLAHLDLRSNNNIVVRKDGRVFVLDLASAVHLRPGSLLHRAFFAFLRDLDVSGLLKWKLCLQPDTITPAERKRIDRYARLSAFWLFNRKQHKRLDRLQEKTGRRLQKDPSVGCGSSDGA
jgi:hypothetical protein